MIKKYSLYSFLFSLIFSALALKAGANTYYWVGNGGLWNDANHWSAISGGNSGAGVPGANDDVVFDKNSFHFANETVTITSSASCRNMQWTDDVYYPVVKGNGTSSLEIYGSLNLALDMQWQFNGGMYFKSSVNNNVISTYGRNLPGNVTFDGSGSWQLNSFLILSCSSTLNIAGGSLHASGNSILCGNLKISGVSPKLLDITRSVLFVNNSIDSTGASNFTCSSVKSYIYYKKYSSVSSFGALNSSLTPPKIATIDTIDTVVVLPSCNCNDTSGTAGKGKCCDGSITITKVVSTNGGQPFKYSWSTGATTSSISNVCASMGSVSCTIIDTSDFSSVTIIINVAISKIIIPVETTKPPKCNGDCNGWIVADINGGTPTYSYSWSSGKPGSGSGIGANKNFIDSALCAGTYTITITDAHKCMHKYNYTVIQPKVVAVTATSTNVTCNGNCNGTAAVSTTTGGHGTPYTYNWSNGKTTTSITGLCPGTYTLTAVDDSGCSGTTSVTITQPNLIVMNPSQTNVSCNGACDGSASVSPTGGTLPYTYKWSPGGQTTSSINGLCASPPVYKVVMTDANGCKDSATFTITQPNPLKANLSKTDVDCNGNCNGKASVAPSGGTTPYTYLWSTGATTTNITGLCASPPTYWVKVTDSHNCVDSVSFTITQPPPLVANPVVYNIKCNGFCTGAAAVHPTGGTTPYTYKWYPSGNTTDSISKQCPGTYTVVVTDKNKCKDSILITITQPPVITINIAQTNVSCSGKCDGTATANVSGGTTAYTYSWSNGKTTSAINNLCAGKYNLLVTDANGCTATATVTITQPNPLSVTLNALPNPLKCFGDCNATISSTVSGGTAAYTYKWSPGGQTTPVIINQCAGTYKLVVTDANGCKDSATVTITQRPQLRDSITAVTNIKCNNGTNGSATVGVKGGTTPYTYSWAPSGGTSATAAGLTAGTYTVTVTDKNGCSVTASVTITQPPALSLAISNTGEKCNGDVNATATVIASGGTPGYGYAWSPGGGTTATITGLSVGCYTVTVTDKNGCTATASTCITQPPPLSAVISSTTSSCNICDGSAKVSASGGTAPYTYLWTPSSQTADSATGLCIGNYTVTVTDANGCTATAKATIIARVKIIVTTSSNTVSCDSICDGLATANPSGGTSPYTYTWSTVPVQHTQTATGLCAGSYTVTVTDANGCSNTDSVTFVNPPKLTVSTTQSNVTCVGKCNGSATATASGGITPYTYTWSNGATTTSVSGLCVGNDTITVTDLHGCSVTAMITISSGASMSDNPVIVSPTCGSSNGSITLSPSGGTGPYTYNWAPPVSFTNTAVGLSTGTYTVTITDNVGCSQTFFIPLNNVTGPTLTAANTGTTCSSACDGTASVTVTSGVGPYTYSWNTGATTTNITNLCAGVYACTVKDANGCITNITDTVKAPKPIKVNPTVQNIPCNGANNGKITLSTSGGTGPYSYNWSPAVSTTSSATGLSAGTYTVTVSDQLACDTVLNITITQPTALSVTVSSTDISCNGANDGTATANVSGGTFPYIYSWSNGGVVATIVNLSAGSYTVTVTDVNGCTSTASVTITEPNPLTGVITGTNVSCNLGTDGGATVVTSGGTTVYTYSWSNGQTTSTLSNVSFGTYYLTITDSHGCTFKDSVKITQPPPITITFTSQNVTCNGDCNGTATANVSGGTAPYTYSWNTIPIQTNQKATGLCAGSYVVTVTDANGCSGNNTVTITQPNPLASNITVTGTSCPTACDGTASSAPSGGTGPYTFKWLPGNKTTSSVTNLCGGTDTLIITDKNGCVDTTFVPIPIPVKLSVVASTSPSNCNASDGSITVTPSGGTPSYTYLWSPGGQTTVTITGLSAGIYTVQVTDSKGCDSSFAIILNNSGGVSSFTNTQKNELCFGDSNGYVVALPTGGVLPYTYFWTNLPAPNGQATDSIYMLTAGTYTLEVTDNSGCIQFDTVTVIQPPALKVVGTINNANCAGVCTGSISLTTSGGTAPYTYKWSTGATTSNISALCPGNDTVLITDADGCILTQIFTVGQNVQITVSTTSTPIPCNGGGTGTATANASGGGGTYTYSWSPGGQTSQTATNLTGGTYTVVVTDQNGCQGTDTANVIQPLPLAVNLKNTPITCNNSCDGKSVANPSGGTSPYTYHWSDGTTADSITNKCAGTFADTVKDANGCVAVDSVKFINPPVMTENHIVTSASCNTTPDGDITVTVSGGISPYTFSWSNGATTQNLNNVLSGNYVLTLTDSTGCVIVDSVTMPADTTVIANAGRDTSFCVGSPNITLDGSKSIGSSLTYQWFILPSRAPIGNTSVVTTATPPLGTTSYILVVMDGTCSDTDTVVVTITPPPVADAGPTKNIAIYTSTTIGGSPTGPAGSTYHWSPAAGLGADTNMANPAASPTVTTTYTVTVVTLGGCISTDTVTVFVTPQVVIPDGFTPNGDGQNDVWVIRNIYMFPNAVVEVYNRWGEELFYSAGYKTPWNGSYNNKPLPVGTYYYIIDLHDSRFPKAYTGPVTIMR